MKVIYKHYLIAVLLAIAAHNNTDRMALGLLLQNIKSDLVLSDTQLGFLTGIAFALFYSIMGMPIARWADRGNRVVIISLSTALWSAAVTVCGAAQSFAQLLLSRVGVAVGEAGCFPTSHSLIADEFERAERPKAVATYLLGPSLGVLIGYSAAGWLNEFYGWRRAFVILGLPGLLLAALAGFSLREPRREGRKAQSSPSPGLLETLSLLWRKRTFRHLLFCMSVMGFFTYGMLQWLPAFFIRSYGLQTGAIGTWFALINGAGGMFGTYLGGEWATRYAAQNERRQLRAIAAACAGFVLFSAAIYLLPTAGLALGSMALAMVGGCAMNGPLYATIQTIVPERTRATAIALIYFLANLIGMGLGPLAVGVMSDGLAPWAGEQSLRYALLALCPGYLWAAWHVWQASHTVEQDLAVPPLPVTLEPAR